MDPYPDFVTSSLSFSLINLQALHSYQLALVSLIPDVDPHRAGQATTLFLQRRREALATKQEGLQEKLVELERMRNLMTAIDQRQGVPSERDSTIIGGCLPVRGARSERELMQETIRLLEEMNQVLKVQLEEERRKNGTGREQLTNMTPSRWNVWKRPQQPGEHPTVPTRPQVPVAHVTNVLDEPAPGPSSTVAPSRLDPPTTSRTVLARMPPPPVSRSVASLPSPGPFFSHLHDSHPSVIPKSLRNELYSVQLQNLPSGVTPLLILHFLRSARFSSFPRPLAIAKSNSGNIWIGFRSDASATSAENLLHGQVLPGLSETIAGQKTIIAISRFGELYPFKFSQLSDELRQSWNKRKQLPDTGAFVSVTAQTHNRVVLSEEYDCERRRILKLVSAEEELRLEREDDNQQRLEMIIRLELEKIRPGTDAYCSAEWYEPMISNGSAGRNRKKRRMK